MEADLAGEGAIGLEFCIAVAAGLVHLVAALPGEVDAFAAGVAVNLALDRTESECTAAVRVEPDLSRSEEVNERGVRELHAGDPPLAEQRVCLGGHDGAAPRSFGYLTRL